MEKYFIPDVYFVTVLVLGGIHVMASISTLVMLYNTKDQWYKAIINKIFINKRFTWILFLTSDFIIAIFAKMLKCSDSFGLQLKWSSNETVPRPGMCGRTSTTGYFPDGLWAFFGILFMLCCLINVTVFLGFSSNVRLLHLKKGRKTSRRDLVPEITRIWMFWLYYLLSDIKSGSFLLLLIPLAGHLSMIYSTLFTGSFVSGIHRNIQLTVYLTGLWFLLGKYSDYII